MNGICGHCLSEGEILKKHVVVAFSGGLDTSFCVVYLMEQGYAVTTVTVNTGGFTESELAQIERLSVRLGARAHHMVDARAELFDGYLRYLIYGNVLRGSLYPLSVSAERIAQAAAVVRIADQVEATALAHGSTGAGNDQIRFDVAFRVLAPELDVLTPIRSLGRTRAEEMAFLNEHGFHFEETVQHYSVNQGMWGTSVGGRETLDSWTGLPEEAFPGGRVDRSSLDTRPLKLRFKRGVPTALDGVELDPVSLIGQLNAIGTQFGIGRGVHLGDTIIGIKGRVGFEAPAAHILISAHRELEKLVLTGKQQWWKETLGNLYGQLLHEGHFFDPVARDIEAFFESSQARVEGEVALVLYPRTFWVEGVRSRHSLMDSAVASYGETNRLWDGDEAAGFAKIYGIQQILALGGSTR